MDFLAKRKEINMINIGDKVVCVDDIPKYGSTEYEYSNDYVKKGEVYNVEGFSVENFNDTGETLCLYLTNKRRYWRYNGEDTGWPAFRFRKLEDVKMENELKRSKGQPVEN